MPVIVHVAKRALLCKSLNQVIVCTDSEEIANKCAEYNISSVITGSHFRNGTERIASIIDNYDFDFAIDIQGDEPLVNPEHINYVAENISNNYKQADILIPTLEVPFSSP